MTQHVFRMLVDGRLVDGSSRFDVINPATALPFATAPRADKAMADAAVAAAKRAFPDWAAASTEHRAALVGKLADALEAGTDEFAHLLTLEQGKPLKQAKAEVAAAVSTLRTFCAMRIAPKLVHEDNRSRVFEHRAPLGVAVAIMPWNFPLLLLMNKLGPAMMTGNTLIAKPAPSTPLTSLLFGELAQNILPPGTFNIICDQHDLAPHLTTHPDVAKVAFTGSTATGKKVLAATASTIKRVTLELGGNDAAIILDDVDPAAVAPRIFAAAMANSGQVCVAIKRVYVPSRLYDSFCEGLVAQASRAVVGDGAEQGTSIGPVQNRTQYDRVMSLIEDARSCGTIVAGGNALNRDGYFIAPTIVRDIDDQARLVREEQFGPVLPVLRYDDLDDAITRANATEYGLGGSIWSRNVDRAMQAALRMECGTVWINQHLAMDAAIPSRGAKQSGLGAELGEAGLLEYTQARTVNLALRRPE